MAGGRTTGQDKATQSDKAGPGMCPASGLSCPSECDNPKAALQIPCVLPSCYFRSKLSHLSSTLLLTARSVNSACGLKGNQPCPSTKIFCLCRTVKNYSGIQAKIEISLSLSLLALYCKQEQRILKKSFIRKGNSYDFEPTHTEEFCSERRAIFSCFECKNYAKPQTSVSSVPFDFL